MSYILEAIKKADHKRKLGEVPDVHSDHDLDLEEPAKRVMWPYLLAALLFFNAAVIAWWLEPWNDKPQVAVKTKIETSSTDTTPAVDATATTTETADPQENIVPPVTPTEEIAPIAATVPEISTDPSSSIGSDSPSQATALAKQEDAPSSITIQPVNKEADLDTAIPTIVPPPISPASPIASTVESAPPEISIDMTSADKLVSESKLATQLKDAGESQTGSIAPLEGIKEVGESDQSSKISDANATATPEKTVLLEEEGEEVNPDEEDEESEVEEIKAFDISKIPLQYQLPMAIQQKLPEIKISFHSYKHRPGSRLVRINGRIMREGQDMTKEVKLEKIVPSGVVMLFDGRRFRVKL